MELMLAIIAVVAVLGLIALGVIVIVLGNRERKELHQLIKSKDFVEYVSMTDEPEEEEDEREIEIDIADIPVLTDESRE